MRETQGHSAQAAAPIDQSVIVVSGLPRSGTSMMMRMLDRGGIPALTDRIRKSDEDNPNGYYEFEPVKKVREDSNWLDLAVGKVVKMVHVLLYDLPPDRPYRVIFMLRDMREVVASQNVMLTRRNRQSADSISPSDLITEFNAQIDRVLSYLREQPSFTFLTVDYNSLMTEPDRQIRLVHEFLDAAVDAEVMRSCIDPGLYRQRLSQPSSSGVMHGGSKG